MSDKKTARLILEDGTQFEGYSFGAETSVSGEVVFNTAMTGYPESLTDPSYSGQILVSDLSADRQLRSSAVYGAGRFAALLRIGPYPHPRSGRLRLFVRAQPLERERKPRTVAQGQRRAGHLGRGHAPDHEDHPRAGRHARQARDRRLAEPAEFVDPNEENLAALVSTKQVETYGNGKYRIVLVDCGCKYNIVRCLTKRNATVIRVPWDYDFTQIDYDGVMLSNGPAIRSSAGRRSPTSARRSRWANPSSASVWATNCCRSRPERRPSSSSTVIGATTSRR